MLFLHSRITHPLQFQLSFSRMTVPPPPPPPGGGPPPIPKSVTERKPIETAEIGDPGKIAKTGKLVRIEHQHGIFF